MTERNGQKFSAYASIRQIIHIATLALAVPPAAIVAAPMYRLTALGGSFGYSVNNHGQVVIQGGNAHQPEALLYSDGTLTNLNSLVTDPQGWEAWWPVAINDHGEIATAVDPLGPPGSPNRAAMYSNGTLKVLDEGAYGWSINNVGQMTAGRSISMGALLYSQGTIVDMGTTAGFIAAYGINDQGQIAGRLFGTRAGLWTPSSPNGLTGTTIDLGRGIANDINHTGQVVGLSLDIGSHAFLWTPTTPNGQTGMMQDLGSLSGRPYSMARAVNDLGDVVGTASPNGICACIIGIIQNMPPNNRAFVYRDEVMYDLNDLVDGSADGWILHDARDINDHGWIVGWGNRGAFLLTPIVPEPSTIIIGAIALVGLAALYRGRTTRNAFATAALLTILISGTAQALTIATVPIGNPGNPGDTEVMENGTSGYGSVGYNYRIGKTEVTNAQYAEFLNAVAATDPYALFNEEMTSYTQGGIVRSGAPNSYTYAVKPTAVGEGPDGSDYTYANKPVVFVSWFDAIRFANWLHNGQGSGDTENGAYTLLGGTPIPSNADSITRNPGAGWFLPSENEWYKAAYYDPDIQGYYDFPTGTDVDPVSVLPADDTGNSANFGLANFSYPMTDAGAYSLSSSPYGTFDQGGNVGEFNEALVFHLRGIRGGSCFEGSATRLNAWYQDFGNAFGEGFDIGFRVATIPDLPGDFNHDGTVDAADYVVWRKTGINGPTGYDTWRTNFGEPGGSGSVTSANATVPEPATLMLMMLPAVGLYLRRRWVAYKVPSSR